MSFQLRRFDYSKNVDILIDSQTKKKFTFSDSVLLLDKVLIHGFSYVNRLTRVSDGVQETGLAIYLQTKQIYLTLAGYKNEQYNSKFPFLFMHERIGNQFEKSIFFLPTPVFITPRLLSIRNSFIEIPSIAGWGAFPPGGYILTMTFFYEPFNEQTHQVDDWGLLVKGKRK